MIRTLLAILLLGTLAYGQTAAPAKYTPTEVQTLRLQLKHKDAELAQIVLQQAQAAFQKSMADLGAEGERIKEEQHWPKEVVFNPNDLSFSVSPPAPPTAKPGGTQ